MGFPCKDCSARKFGCHDTCSAYAEAKKQKELENKAYRNDQQFAIPAVNTMIRSAKFRMGGIR